MANRKTRRKGPVTAPAAGKSMKMVLLLALLLVFILALGLVLGVILLTLALGIVQVIGGGHLGQQGGGLLDHFIAR